MNTSSSHILRDGTVQLNWPLMDNNITRGDLDELIGYLSQPNPMLTQSAQVRAFEQEWSEWLGIKYSVFVNSGASANLCTIAALRALHGDGEVIVPTLTWISDIASVLHARLEPVFVDINPRTLGMDTDQVLAKLTSRTRAVFITHILGYNALDQRLVDILQARGIPLIEDVCESHGATFRGRRCGSIGWASNFSFYFAHHMSTIEGGMVSTNDPDLFNAVRLMRSHGMVRESPFPEVQSQWKNAHPDLNPDFIFAHAAFNVRSTELNAVLGRSQLKRLDENVSLRTRNLKVFLDCIDSDRFQTDFALEGSSNYAFTLVIKNSDPAYRDRIENTMREARIEFRRGTSGGGNQLRQPYLKKLYPGHYKQFPAVEHVHFYGYYVGNYPTITTDRIHSLCNLLNSV